MIYLLTVSFALGILSEQIFDLGLGIALFFILISVTVFFILRKSITSRKIIFCILFFSIGILRMGVMDTSPDQELQKQVGQKISFEGIIVDEPDVRDSSIRYTVSISQNSFSGYSQKCTDIFLLENSCVASPRSGSQGISGNTHSKNFISRALVVAERFPEFEYGDKIKVTGKLDLPKNFESENGTEFDYVSYLSKDKIHFLIYRPEIQKIGNEEVNFLISHLYSFKKILIEKIGAVVPEPNSSLLAGIIFGAKQSLGEDLLLEFKKAGLIHIVVLSGYNITVIAYGIFYATNFLNKRNLGFILSAIFIILFALMVGLGATVVRACIMALIAILAKFLGRPADALRWLFIAGMAMLFWNPLILLSDPSFQLSFLATLGLILFSPFIHSFISKSKFAKFVPEKLELREIVSSTLAVQLFVLPLLIKMSGFVSIISFIVNPIILPLVPWAMAVGALTAVLGLVPTIFGQILSWVPGALSYLLTQIIISATEFSAQIPLSTFQTGSIPLWLIFIWYAGYGVLYWKLTSPRTSCRPLLN